MSIPTKSRAFTLIELLVVIAIIAILAAILFPIFAQAKGAAKKTQALSNLGQIGKAIQLYASDFDEHLPPQSADASVWPGFDVIVITIGDHPWFKQAYTPYLKSDQVWFSPEDRLLGKTRDGLPTESSFSINSQLSYAWPLSAITRPAETIYMTDRTDLAVGTPVNTYTWWSFTGGIMTSADLLPGVIDPVEVVRQISPNRYVGKVAVYQFLDSHVKAMKFEATWGDKTRNMHLAVKS